MGHFRVRREARLEVDGVERRVQLLNPSMYFSVETVRELDGTPVGDTGFGVNNVYLNGVRMAAVLPNGEAQYYLTDQVDSVKVVTNDSGQVVTAHEYLPFGESWITEGNEKNAPKYNSQELDKESGYYFYNARHYDPEIGRFVTADTVVPDQFSTQSWNRFSYCRNNPIIYKDPTGHAEEIKDEGILSKLSNAGSNYLEGIKDTLPSINQLKAEVKEIVDTCKKYTAAGPFVYAYNKAVDIGHGLREVYDNSKAEANIIDGSYSKYAERKLGALGDYVSNNIFRSAGNLTGILGQAWLTKKIAGKISGGSVAEDAVQGTKLKELGNVLEETTNTPPKYTTVKKIVERHKQVKESNKTISDINKAIKKKDWEAYDKLVDNQHWGRGDIEKGFDFESYRVKDGKTTFIK